MDKMDGGGGQYIKEILVPNWKSSAISLFLSKMAALGFLYILAGNAQFVTVRLKRKSRRSMYCPLVTEDCSVKHAQERPVEYVNLCEISCTQSSSLKVSSTG